MAKFFERLDYHCDLKKQSGALWSANILGNNSLEAGFSRNVKGTLRAEKNFTFFEIQNSIHSWCLWLPFAKLRKVWPCLSSKRFCLFQ